MGDKPPVVASPATVVSTPSDHSASGCGRFAMPHALVLTAFIVTAAFLAPDARDVQDVLLLLAGAGGIGSAVVTLAVAPFGMGGRLGRLVRAYFSAGS